MSRANKRCHSGQRLTEIVLFLVLAVSYAYTFPRWADPNQNSRLDMVFAIVEDGTLRIDKYVANTVDYARVGEHYYSDKAPGVAFLGVPLYAGLKLVLDQPIIEGIMSRLEENTAFKATLRPEGTGLLEHKVRFALAQIFLTLAISILPSALLGVLIYRVVARLKLNQWSRLSIALGYGLLTPVFAYAGAFYGHQLSAVLLFAAFHLVFILQGQPSAARLALVGLFLGYSVVSEYPAFLIAAVLGVYTLAKLYQMGCWRRLVWVVLTAGMVGAGLMAYNAYVFGSPLDLGYSHSELWQSQHQAGFISLTRPHWQAIWGITFSPYRGLFLYSPFLLLAIPGFWLWWRTREMRSEFWLALTSVLALFLFISSSIMWWGGFAVGPRYLLPMLPFLALPIAFTFRRWDHLTGFKLLIAALFLWSLVVVWGLTLAGQAFPSDAILNPWLDYALPNWLAGDIARNLGTLLGLPGFWSLAPLLGIIGMIGLGWYAKVGRLHAS